MEKILSKFSNKTNSRVISVSTFDSPLGYLVAAADEKHLYFVLFEDSKHLEKKLQQLNKELSCSFKIDTENEVLKSLQGELELYFEGKLSKFTAPIKLTGSEFQKEVWKKLQKLPYSSTQTYGDLAKAMGKPSSHARAIGSACGSNSHLILIPCHRLIASNSNGGFTGGGDRKEWLLKHEKKHINLINK